MVRSEQLDKNKVKSLIDRRHALLERSFEPVFAKIADFRALLKPEQKKEAVELLEKFASRWREE